MTILVTGGAGFIGSHFVRLCVRSGLRIVVLDKLTYAGDRSRLRDLEDADRCSFVQGDVADLELVGRILREHQITAVAHFAAETHVDRSIDAPALFFETNALGTARLLDACRLYFEELAAQEASFRFFHISTDEVYGSIAPGKPPVDEDAALAPNSPYAASKAAAELAARAYAHTYGLPIVIARCSNAYGPSQYPEKLIPLTIREALAGQPLPIYGDGANERDWIFVEDLCEALRRILEHGRIGETYNVGGGCWLPNIELVDQICQLLDELRPSPGGQSYANQKTFVRDRPGHDFRYAMDCSKIQAELGWRPRTPLQEGLRRTVLHEAASIAQK